MEFCISPCLSFLLIAGRFERFDLQSDYAIRQINKGAEKAAIVAQQKRDALN